MIKQPWEVSKALAMFLCIALLVLFASRLPFARYSPPAEVAQSQAIGVGMVKVKVTTSGTSGYANGTANTDEMVRGAIQAVYLDYASPISTTTDVTLAHTSTPSENILSMTDHYTDSWVYPRRVVHDNTGTAVTYDGSNEIYEPYWSDDYLTLTVTNTGVITDCVTVYVFWK